MARLVAAETFDSTVFLAVRTGNEIPVLQEGHPGGFISGSVAVTVLRWVACRGWLVAKEEMVHSRDVGRELVQSPGVVIFELAPERAVSSPISPFEETHCHGLQFGSCQGPFVELGLRDG
jgi:hypothetical protein